jgi:glycosyltransferase involved in cell wall biosynthesis
MSSPIRILQVLAGMNRGGSETLIMNIYRNIDRAKVQFDFILFRSEECDFNEEIRNLGGKIHYIPRYNGKNHFKFKKSWNSFFKEHPEYKIIHGHVRSTASIYLKIAKKYGLVTIAHSHSTSSRGNKIEQLAKNLIQYPIRYIASYLFACSDAAGKWLFGSKYIKKDNFKIVHNAIESEQYIYNELSRSKQRKKLNIDNKIVFGHIGSFTHPKNHAFLIDVFKAVHDKNENAVLILVGDGELRSSIEEKIRDLKLTNNVILTGVRSDIPELLQAMDVFVFPSLFEGLGIVAVEAQAAGLPCIVADTIPKEAFVTDLIKILSLKDSPVLWAEMILDNISHKRKDTQQEIIKQGYDIKETVKWLEEFYLNI